MEINKDNGFTLVEIMIAITILSIGILSVASMQISAINTNSLANNLTKATTIAQNKIEQLISASYNDADLEDKNGNGHLGLRNPLPPSQKNPNQQPDITLYPPDYQEAFGSDHSYTIYWNVSLDDPIENTKTISVIVTWPHKDTIKNVIIKYIKLLS